MLSSALLVVVGLLSGVIVALRYIAPRTATKVDDEILAAAEKVEPLVDALKK